MINFCSKHSKIVQSKEYKCWFLDTQRMNLCLPGGRVEGGIVRESGVDMYTLLFFKMDNQQGPTVWHREHCSIFCNNLTGKNLKKNI